MTGLELSNLGWIAASCYALAVASALMPWVNAEVLTLSAAPLAGSPIQMAGLVAIVTLGQMTGKTAMYCVSRRATRPRSARLQQAIDRWGMQLQRHPRSAMGIILASSTLGVPPFYLVAVAAGALKIGLGQFLAIGTFGRLIHFAVVAFVPQLVWRSL
jgi:membrane protein YqaA with SNARE-associated domain